ncbi:response regulator [Cohnella sp. CFH 77786]|uniref:response regulator n=1 Tax=Cohnella sp. CFH 77786 TaxID=2662265 RepID=UPI001C609667|nr:response regulator [Cohnella sp. CFH 77786]MBW5444950.1 response regulator [Cohnella sp. CFH 77786]
MKEYRVVLIEDDPMVREVNRQFIEKVPGFRVVASASDGQEGMRIVREKLPDLAIIDIFMPGMDGIETLRQMRRENLPVDAIVVTAAKDAATINQMLRGGAIDYLIKPFEASRLQQALQRYRILRDRLERNPTLSQPELDSVLLAAEHPGGTRGRSTGAPSFPDQDQLPKGLNAVTLRQIWSILQAAESELSAEEVADKSGLARVTARRYLDYLEKNEWIRLDMRYGGVGRPVNRYTIVRNQNDQKGPI